MPKFAIAREVGGVERPSNRNRPKPAMIQAFHHSAIPNLKLCLRHWHARGRPAKLRADSPAIRRRASARGATALGAVRTVGRATRRAPATFRRAAKRQLAQTESDRGHCILIGARRLGRALATGLIDQAAIDAAFQRPPRLLTDAIRRGEPVQQLVFRWVSAMSNARRAGRPDGRNAKGAPTSCAKNAQATRDFIVTDPVTAPTRPTCSRKSGFCNVFQLRWITSRKAAHWQARLSAMPLLGTMSGSYSMKLCCR